jgi:hypothetical protein
LCKFNYFLEKIANFIFLNKKKNGPETGLLQKNKILCLFLKKKSWFSCPKS